MQSLDRCIVTGQLHVAFVSKAARSVKPALIRHLQGRPDCRVTCHRGGKDGFASRPGRNSTDVELRERFWPIDRPRHLFWAAPEGETRHRLFADSVGVYASRILMVTDGTESTDHTGTKRSRE